MAKLYFTNDFVNNHSEYASMTPFCSPLSPLTDDGKRAKSASWVEATLPLKGNQVMRESMISFVGKKIRYGKLFEVIDAVAADTCYKHIGLDGDNTAYAGDVVIVTACVEGMLAKSHIESEEDLTIQSFLTHVGRTSMEVHVNLLQHDEIVASTHFVFVAQKEGKGYPVPGLILDGAHDIAEFEKGELRSAKRREKGAKSLELSPPLQHEVELMHNIYLRTKDLEQVSGGDNSSKRAFKYINETQVDSHYLMHKQQRNVHNKIFGGELMRISFDMAFICARCFTGTDNCHFYAVDDINFLKPVSIGAVMEFTGRVVYSSGKYLVIVVVVEELDVQTDSRIKTNQLTYIFKSDRDDQLLPEVLPREYEEMVRYLSGKRTHDYCLEGASR
jgi:acyl-coenzyme A thioesterase 9